MNPFRWKAEHRVAWLVFILLGFLVGLWCAWLEDPFHYLAQESISGAFANKAHIFMM
jgi:hypothetical protein